MDLYDEIKLNEILRALQGDGAIPLDDPVFGPGGPMQFDPPSSANDDAYLKLSGIYGLLGAPSDEGTRLI